ncbi:hypothetical protein LIER_20171 [Lithospermum erythrorhizon]|uniref:Uncharacterized protein n=1 Tax=Lithospermum erythrorhizon TaxID=34254 RepID=A0AAV3QKH3_LITER
MVDDEGVEDEWLNTKELKTKRFKDTNLEEREEDGRHSSARNPLIGGAMIYIDFEVVAKAFGLQVDKVSMRH